mgnify:CR=1 FL=1
MSLSCLKMVNVLRGYSTMIALLSYFWLITISSHHDHDLLLHIKSSKEKNTMLGTSWKI